ncbi:MAG: hypothetical protein AAFR82_01860 [Pseudomonadota bacterium]
MGRGNLGLAIVIFVGGCAASTAFEPDTSPKETVFERAEMRFESVRTAAKACHIPQDDKRKHRSCPGQVEIFDRQACIAFDEAIQPLLEPLRGCTGNAAIELDASQSQACQTYMAKLMQPCIGVHAIQMAYRDLSSSASYREAIAGGMDEALANEKFLSQIVRYRN